MSDAALVVVDFKNNITHRTTEFGNAWGLMPVIWDMFARHYIGMRPGYHSYQEIVPRLDKKLPIDLEAPKCYIPIFRLTHDRAFVEHKDFPRLAADLDQFFASFPKLDKKYINHWPAICFELGKMAMGSELETPALGFYNSIVGNVWEPESGVLNPENYLNVYGEHALPIFDQFGNA